MQNEPSRPFSSREPPMSRVPLAESSQRRSLGENAARAFRIEP